LVGSMRYSSMLDEGVHKPILTGTNRPQAREGL
jgi:hypothetical protein